MEQEIELVDTPMLNPKERSDGQSICGAQYKDGNVCRRRPVTGRNRCARHGGKSAVGINSGQYKTGKYSKYLPARLLEKYDTASNDPDLLSLKDEIALVDSRLADLLTKIDTGDSASIFKRLHAAWKEYKNATPETQSERLAEVGKLISLAYKEEGIWDDIHKTLDQRNRLVSSERKRYVEMSMMITADRAAMLIAQVAHIVKENVKDKNELRTITASLTGLLSIPANQGD